jgi:hypothetical protein
MLCYFQCKINIINEFLGQVVGSYDLYFLSSSFQALYTWSFLKKFGGDLGPGEDFSIFVIDREFSNR